MAATEPGLRCGRWSLMSLCLVILPLERLFILIQSFAFISVHDFYMQMIVRNVQFYYRMQLTWIGGPVAVS